MTKRHQKKSLRDFFWWEVFNLGRDVLSNGRGTKRHQKKSLRDLFWWGVLNLGRDVLGNGRTPDAGRPEEKKSQLYRKAVMVC